MGKANVKYYAPNIDHTKGAPEDGATRNVLVEAARIARGNVADLKELKAADHDAIVFPGGFGAAKNLCNIAVEGPNATINPDVDRVIKDFFKAGKPQGFCCVAPTLAAIALGDQGVEITMGSYE